jgi:hypothetical protein
MSKADLMPGTLDMLILQALKRADCTSSLATVPNQARIQRSPNFIRSLAFWLSEPNLLQA